MKTVVFRTLYRLQYSTARNLLVGLRTELDMGSPATFGFTLRISCVSMYMLASEIYARKRNYISCACRVLVYLHNTILLLHRSVSKKNVKYGSRIQDKRIS